MKSSVFFQRITLILFSVLFLQTSLFAAVIPEKVALRIAGDFVFWNPVSRSGAPALRLSHVVKSGGTDRIYIYNVDGGGWVMVSGDDNTRRDVLGYSTTGNFDYSALPVNARNWIEGYADVIAQLESHPEYIQRDSVMPSRAMGTSISPLLGEIAWNQGEPYNLLCPELSNGERAVTGCIATAMAQIMMYHRYPEAGRGCVSYKWMRQTLSAEFGKYDWNLMALKYLGNESEASREAVAKLMRDCGYSVKMDYGSTNLGAFFSDIPNALINYFNYDCSLMHLYQSHCDLETWENIIRKEIDSSRPVLYKGAFLNEFVCVCDGYDKNGYFHFNWGDGGADDGYYHLFEVIPFDQEIIYGIQPNYGGKVKGYFVMERLQIDADCLRFDGQFSRSYHGDATIELGYSIENKETGETHTYSLNEFGLNDGKGLSKSFVPQTAGLQDGDYIVYLQMRCDGETEWRNCFYMNSKFSSDIKKYWNITVKDGKLLSPYISRTIDGVTYGNAYINGSWRTVVDVVDIDADKDKIIIPSTVKISDEIYPVGSVYISDKENLVSLTTETGNITITNCPNLRTLICNGPSLNGSCDSPVLEDIKLSEKLKRYNFQVYNEKPLKLDFPIKHQGLCIEGGSFLNSFLHLSTTDVVDIYLHSDIPPVFKNKELCGNINFTFHIPIGTMDIYTNAGFGQIGMLIEDITSSSYNIEWGLNGGIYDELSLKGFAYGKVMDMGTNNVEYAVKLKKEVAESYKGNKITAITFFTGEYNEVGYVFLSKDDNGYIMRQNVNARGGAITTVHFDKPYTITGEPIYFGIGNKGSMGITFARTDYTIPDNMYVRVLGSDYVICPATLGKWYYRTHGGLFTIFGDSDPGYPLPISITIEGQSLPIDASILCVNVDDSDNTSEVAMSDMEVAYKQNVKNVDNNSVYKYINTADNISKIKLDNGATRTTHSTISETNNSDETTMPEIKLFNDSCRMTVHVQNRSERKIHSLKLKTIAGEREIDTEYNKTLAVNQTAVIPVSFPIKDMDNEFTVSTTVVEIDGNVDNIPDDGVTTARIMNYSRSETYPLRAVVEKFTTALRYDARESSWKDLEKMYPDNYIGIDIHCDDEMANPENYYYANWNYNVFNWYTNRMAMDYITASASEVNFTSDFENKKYKATESVKISKAITNGERCEVTVDVVSACPIDGKSLALAFIILEDQVGPYQKKCFVGIDENNTRIFEFRDELFDNVARGIYDGFHGVTGLLPKKMESNVPYTVSYSFIMPENIQNLDNTKIVALLIDDSTRKDGYFGCPGVIMNADRMKLEIDRSQIGVTEVTLDTDDIIKVEGNQILTTVTCDRLDVFTIDGKRTVSENLAKGFYVVRATVNGRTFVKKIVIQSM